MRETRSDEIVVLRTLILHPDQSHMYSEQQRLDLNEGHASHQHPTAYTLSHHPSDLSYTIHFTEANGRRQPMEDTKVSVASTSLPITIPSMGT